MGSMYGECRAHLATRTIILIALQRQFGRLLRFMRMFGAGVDFKFAEHHAPEFVFRQHAAHRIFDDARRVFVDHFLKRCAFDAAGMPGMPPIHFVVCLVAGERNFGGVDDDNIIAGVDMRRIFGLMLAAQPACDLGRQPPEHLILGVNHKPFAFDGVGGGGKCFHRIVWLGAATKSAQTAAEYSINPAQVCARRFMRRRRPARVGQNANRVR